MIPEKVTSRQFSPSSNFIPKRKKLFSSKYFEAYVKRMFDRGLKSRREKLRMKIQSVRTTFGQLFTVHVYLGTYCRIVFYLASYRRGLALIVSRIKVLPPMVFENLNSLETLNLQNNKLARIPEDITETVLDTLRMIDITGKI